MKKSGRLIGPKTNAWEAHALVGVGPAAVANGLTTMSLGSLKKLVVHGTDANDDGATIGPPQGDKDTVKTTDGKKTLVETKEEPKIEAVVHVV